ncbi:hypothetical protein PTSG_13171 [Salpingoeca rosetta]|uniref:Uncharacterized protein n=1 Tax=Salpingoeca rosetta (strain ATCC 50818 / BSB-021) TaxID=946362 RepID=F2UT22_SALR5|nr:uncharacterized protein PTSG_13171 [Salpingoeca rosetta]EGD81281.1 hypothetical protein PTSG_13171 [Salpingoeca rosetta]|eukprot:XP_004987677.1 hypothetical protein PTSG_13171 [Salpingoeca rosetta]
MLLFNRKPQAPLHSDFPHAPLTHCAIILIPFHFSFSLSFLPFALARCSPLPDTTAALSPSAVPGVLRAPGRLLWPLQLHALTALPSLPRPLPLSLVVVLYLLFVFR